MPHAGVVNTLSALYTGLGQGTAQNVLYEAALRSWSNLLAVCVSRETAQRVCAQLRTPAAQQSRTGPECCHRTSTTGICTSLNYLV